MKSLHIGVFNPTLIYTASPYCGDEVFAKGFEKNGFDVIRFDYRASADCNTELQNISININPDVVWLGKCERLTEETIISLRNKFKDAIFCSWAADVRDTPTTHDLAKCRHIDYFFGTFGGDYLRAHLTTNMRLVCSILAFTDSDFYKKYEITPEFESDVLWTGHRCSGDNSLRNQVIDYLSVDKYRSDHRRHVNVLGLNEWLGYPEYNKYMTGAKIGIGVNSFKRTKYSSDRLGNYLATGTFFLTEKIEGLAACFRDGVHVDSFSTVEEMNSKVNYYLTHDDEREGIAREGQKLVLDCFDCKPLVKNILHIINTGQSLYDWDDLYTT